MSRAPPELLHAGVSFPPLFARRLERFALRVSAARERREGAGSAALAGRGEEFVGYRPYRPGEDLRPIDWNLYARLDRPYVRVTRREASESWEVLVDTSASMGVGPPGKLQACAELACALASIALRQGARTTIHLAGAGGSLREARVRVAPDLPRALGFLEGARARGTLGIASALASWRPSTGAGRVFVCGDLLDLEPAGLAALRRVGRELFAVQILAPHELVPPEQGGVEWIDPETGERSIVELDSALAAAYRRELDKLLESWRASCARHGVVHMCASSDQPFEVLLPRLLGLTGATPSRGSR